MIRIEERSATNQRPNEDTNMTTTTMTAATWTNPKGHTYHLASRFTVRRHTRNVRVATRDGRAVYRREYYTSLTDKATGARSFFGTVVEAKDAAELLA
jgi:hypothetical protein